MSQDLEDVIVSAVEDSVSSEPAEVDSTPTEAVDTTSTEASEAPSEAPEGTTPDEPVADTTDGLVASPTAKAAAAAAKPEQDDFEKKFGIPRESSPGRENRIPHSRVVKIVGKAVADAKAELTPKLQEYETKIKEYETKDASRVELENKVKNFERIVLEDKPAFIAKLRNIPGYAELLDAAARPATQAGQPTPQAVPAVSPDDPRPEPDQVLEDGSRVYSLEGLDRRDEWNRAQARKETLEEVKKLYGPIAQDHEERQRQAQAEKYRTEVLIPKVEAQIKEAHSWQGFKENEDAIVKVLNEHPEYNLERAYQTVVFPKLLADQNTMRKQILEELRKAPVATSAPTSGTRPAAVPTTKSGPRDLEDIIREAASGLTR